MSTFVHHIPTLETPARLSDYLIGIFAAVPTRKGIKKAIKRNRVKVDGKLGTTGLFVVGGETVELMEEVSNTPVLELELEVVYEDDYLAIIYKPPGLLVSGNKWMTVANALPHNLQPSKSVDALARPQPVHRLDYPTSGLLLVGKTAGALMTLGNLFKDRKITKTYYAISIGKMPHSGEMAKDIAQQTAHCYFEVLKRVPSPRFKTLNLVKLMPTTGRRHQLRIQLASLGNPILGDREYGMEGLILQGKGLYLHAAVLEFTHPLTGGEMKIEVGLPKKFLKLFPASI